MEWQDTGIVLSARRHGEGSIILNLLTAAHGRHAGLVKGGASRRSRGIYEPGNFLSATWRARLPEHLGSYTAELVAGNAALLMDDPLKLAALTSALSLCDTGLPENHAYPAIYDGLLILIESLKESEASWPTVYVKWELGLLGELGFGLDLSCCAATGVTDNLTYVSPKSARAVSEDAAAPYIDKLIPLPPFLLNPGTLASPDEVLQGLNLTAFFLERHVFPHKDHSLPDARRRLMERLRT